MVGYRKSLTVGLLAVLVASCFVGLVQADAGWLEGYNKRMLFYWQSSGAGQSSFTVINQTNFNTANTFYIFNETQPDFEDLNVTLADGVTPLALWNQTTNYGKNCTVWANFPTANTSYYLYWDNPNAVVSWNQTSVFDAVLSDVVLALPLNEGIGSTAYDHSGNNNDGAITGASWVDGKYGKALQFNASEADFIDVLDPSFHDYAIGAVSIWFNFTTLPAEATLFSYFQSWNDYFYLFTNNIGQIIARFVIGGVTSNYVVASGVQAGAWHNFVLMQDGVSLKGYLDGVERVADTTRWFADIGLAATSDIKIGRFQIYAVPNGAIDEIYIHYSNFSTTDVLALYSGFGDPEITTGSVLVRSWITGNSISLFGSVESAPITVDPDALTAEDGVAVAVVFGIIAIALAAAFAFARKRD